eukprot:scaffold152695_cov38-Cyclotella_meneghiniana.AAC.2
MEERQKARRQARAQERQRKQAADNKAKPPQPNLLTPAVAVDPPSSLCRRLSFVPTTPTIQN